MTRAKKLPCPRLELRWRELPDDSDGRANGYTIECVYSFVFPLDKYDIRAEYHGPRGGHKFGAKREKAIEIGRTFSTGTVAGRVLASGEVDAPFRDGAHATWDAPHFGNPPIYVIAGDVAWKANQGSAA